MTKNQDRQKLVEAFLKIKNTQEAEQFLTDLLSDTEWKDFSNRFKIAEMLKEGHSYVQIESITGTSSTTIARIAKCLKRQDSGYNLVLSRM